MSVNLWLKASMLVPALCLAGFSAYGQQQQSNSQQSSGDQLAEAARKAREEKKTAPKPKKVYTDDDVSRHAPAPAAAPAPASTGSASDQGRAGVSSTEATAVSEEQKATGEQKTEKVEKAEDPNSEGAWRKRFKDQRDKIAKAEKELDILQRETEKAQVQYYPDPQKAMTQQNTRSDVNALTAKIAAKRQEIAQLKQGLDDLEVQLRKSGGDTGWAR